MTKPNPAVTTIPWPEKVKLWSVCY